MKREDIHRPGAIVPGDYEFVAVFAARGDEDLLRAYSDDPTYRETITAPDVRLFKGNWDERRLCDSCGASFYHGALMRHKSGELVHFGHICADKQIGLSPEAHRAKREAIERAARYRAARLREEERKDRPLLARYASVCPACKRKIRLGEEIEATPTRWKHKLCPPEHTQPGLPRAKKSVPTARSRERVRVYAGDDDRRILSKFRERGFRRV